MEKYRVLVSKTAEKTIRKIPKKDLPSIVEKISSLATQPRPRGARKLAGEVDVYRIRSGNYRILYEINDDEILILILKVGHRRDVYR